MCRPTFMDVHKLQDTIASIDSRDHFWPRWQIVFGLFKGGAFMDPSTKGYDAITPLLDLLSGYALTPDMLSSNTALSNDNLPRLLQMSSDLAGDRSIAFRLAKRLDLSALGAFGFALLSCAELKQALQLTLRFHVVIAKGTLWELVEVENGVAMRLMTRIVNPAQKQLLTEYLFTQVGVITEFLVGHEVGDTQVHLTHSAPEYSSLYDKYLPWPVEFNASHNQVVIPEHLLMRPVKSANSQAHAIYLEQCEDLLRGLNEAANVTASVRRQLIFSAHSFPDFSHVAQQLNTSERTLRRQLQLEGTHFRAVADEVKNALAKKYLTGTTLPMSDIAHLLGYAEAFHFRRAFSRWNRMTPQQFRTN